MNQQQLFFIQSLLLRDKNQVPSIKVRVKDKEQTPMTIEIYTNCTKPMMAYRVHLLDGTCTWWNMWHDADEVENCFRMWGLLNRR